MKKQPEITARTRARILDAFGELYKENRIEKISIGALMRSAGLNRGTFYEYFTDIYDLLDAYEDRMILTLTGRADQYFRTHPEQELPFSEITGGFSRILTDYEEEIVLLLEKAPTFRVKLRTHLRERMLATIHMDAADPYLEYYLSFVIASITNLIECWHSNHKDITGEELLAFSQQLVFHGFLGGLQKYNPDALPPLSCDEP